MDKDEKPLDRMVYGYSRTSIFRKIAFIGDSLSSGEFETKDKNNNSGYHDMFDYSWGQFIARKNGLVALNFSCGGMTAQQYVESFADAADLWNKEKACQAYVVALGVNEIYNKNMGIGSTDDIDVFNYKNNKKSFLGYYATIISRYKEISPDAKFFFVTFPDENRAELEGKANAVKNALQSLTEVFDNSYLINLYDYGPIYDDEFRRLYYLHGHLNPSGYILTAEIIDSYIDYIVRHNPEDFRNVGFIGTDIKYRF